MTTDTTTFAGLTEILRHSLGDRLASNAVEFLDMFAETCLFELPYAPPGFISRIEGRDALGRYLEEVVRLISVHRFFDVNVHPATDGSTVIIQFKGEGKGQSGAPYNQHWISVIETADGYITRYIDYWNPLLVLEAAGDARPKSVQDAVLVTGGTGTTGSRIAARLAERKVYHKIATRQPKGARDIWFDWKDEASWPSALDGVTSVYVVAPSGESELLQAMTPFLLKAVETGVRRFVLLSASSLEAGGPMMGSVHAWLCNHAPEWIVLRPTWFMQNFIGQQHVTSIRDEDRICTAAEDGRIGFIDASDIADVAVEALTRPDMGSGDLILTGPEALSYDDVAASLTQALGRPIRHVRVSVEELQTQHEALGLPRDYAKTLAGMDGDIAKGSEDRLTTTVREVTGRDPTTLADFVREHAAAWERRHTEQSAVEILKQGSPQK